MKGIIELPLENGRKELCWYVGTANTAGGNQVNPTVAMKTERDADFVAKRLFLVQWPSFGVGIDQSLRLPFTTTAVMRDGGTKRGLSLVASQVESIFLNADPLRMQAAYLGLPSPFLIRGNTNLFAELSNPAAIGTPWTGDLYLVGEGYKIYPNLPEEIPSKIKSYAVPYDLNANGIIADPSLASGNVRGQSLSISNNGEGKFIAKSLTLRIADATGADKTAQVLPCLGFQLVDTTSGGKRWIQNTTPGQTVQFAPASLLTMAGTQLPFNMPRYLDPQAVVNVQVVFPELAAALMYLNGLGNWPYTFSISLKGALLPA